MLNQRSLDRLKGVNPDLVEIVLRASNLSSVPFVVTEGIRTTLRQAELVARGSSKTMASKHITGRAIDVAAVVDGKVTWEWKYYAQIAIAFKKAAAELGIRLVWGGDWKYFKDGPHFELV